MPRELQQHIEPRKWFAVTSRETWKVCFTPGYAKELCTIMKSVQEDTIYITFTTQMGVQFPAGTSIFRLWQ